MRRATYRADAILELVRNHAVEAAQPVLALVDRLARQPEKMRHRRLPYHLDGVSDALPANEEVTAIALDSRLLRDIVEKGEDDSAQNLELLQDLVSIESLLVTERAQLHRFWSNGIFGVEIRARAPEVGGDAFNEKRHVIQQAFRRKDVHRIQRHARLDALEPAGYEVALRLPKPVSEQRGQLARVFGLD